MAQPNYIQRQGVAFESLFANLNVSGTITCDTINANNANIGNVGQDYLDVITNSSLTVSGVESNVVFATPLLSSNFIPSGAGFIYVGATGGIFRVSVTAYGTKVATNTQLQIRVNKLTSPPLPQIVASGQVFVDKTEGHLITMNEIIDIGAGDVIFVSYICSTGTCQIASPPAVGGVVVPSVTLSINQI